MVNPNVTQDEFAQTTTTRWLETMCEHQQLEATLEQALPWLGHQLRCDRVFLYVRSPQSQVGRVPYCWVKNSHVPKVYDPDWKVEPPSLPDEDPMFAAALKAQPSLFIDDVETASPEVVNRDFERQTFGHRALIHAHLCIERKLWGILQACVFDHPREWSRGDRQLIEQTVGWFAPYAMEYVNQYAPNTLENC